MIQFREIFSHMYRLDLPICHHKFIFFQSKCIFHLNKVNVKTEKKFSP